MTTVNDKLNDDVALLYFIIGFVSSAGMLSAFLLFFFPFSPFLYFLRTSMHRNVAVFISIFLLLRFNFHILADYAFTFFSINSVFYDSWS